MDFPPDTSPMSDTDPYSNVSSSNAYSYDVNTSRLASPYLGRLIGYNTAFRTRILAARLNYTTNAIQRHLTPEEAQALSEHTARMIALAGDITVLGGLSGLWRAYATRSTFRFPFNALKFETSTSGAGAAAAAAGEAAGAEAGAHGGSGTTGSGETPKGRVFNPNRFLNLRGLNAQYAWHTCRGASYVLIAMAFSSFFAQSYSAAVTSVHEARDPRLEDVERRLIRNVKTAMEERRRRRSGGVLPQGQAGSGAENVYGDGNDDASPSAGGGWDEQTAAEMAALSGRGRNAGEYESEAGMVSDEQMRREQQYRQRAAVASPSSIRRKGMMERSDQQAGSFNDDDGFIGGGTDYNDASPAATTPSTSAAYGSSASRRVGSRPRMESRDDGETGGDGGGGGSAWDRLRQRSSSSSSGGYDQAASSSGRDGWMTTSPSSASSSSRELPPATDDMMGDGGGDEGEKKSAWAQRRQRALNSSRE